MRALPNKAIVKVNLEQKDRHGNLFMVKRSNPDGKEANPVLCTIIDVNSKEYPYLKEGDELIVWHNYFEPSTHLNPNIYFINKEYPYAYYTIPVTNSIYARIENGEPHPVCGNMICERILKPLPSTILIIPDTAIQHYSDRVVVLKTAPEVKDYKAGDTVLIHKWGDPEICYNYNNIEKRFIKVWQDDAIGTIP